MHSTSFSEAPRYIPHFTKGYFTPRSGNSHFLNSVCLHVLVYNEAERDNFSCLPQAWVLQNSGQCPTPCSRPVMTKCQRFYYLLILLTTIPDKTDGQTCVCICFICYLLLNIYIGTRMCKLYFSNVYARSAPNKLHRQPAGRLHTASFFQFLIYKIKRWIPASILLLLSEQLLDGLKWELSHSGTLWPEIGGEGWREASKWNRPTPGKSLKKVRCWAGPGLASVTVCSSRGMAACSYPASSSEFTTLQRSWGHCKKIPNLPGSHTEGN